MTTPIECLVIMGDSLSDQGTMYHRKLLGLKSLKSLSGLKEKSPRGRFTNGYTWNDQFITLAYESALIKMLKNNGKRADDIADDIICRRPEITQALHKDFELNHQFTKVKKHDFVRNYSEGGVTSYDYSRRLTRNLKLLGTEKIISNLDRKRRLLLEDDEARGITKEEKKKTLVIEWTGINDLITVNVKPSIKGVNRAIKARLNNVEELVHKGYRNFLLFNLPDFSQTPRYALSSEKKQNNARQLVLYFNQSLHAKLEKLGKKYPYCSINIFNVSQFFSKIYNEPQLYQLATPKMTLPYTESEDFKLNQNGASPAPEYMFWDDVHPTAKIHALLGFQVFIHYQSKYNFILPLEDLLAEFRHHYGQSLMYEQRKFFSNAKNVKFAYKSATLEAIFEEALYSNNYRARNTMVELGWINKKGQIIYAHPSLIKAAAKIAPEDRQEEEMFIGGFRKTY